VSDSAQGQAVGLDGLRASLAPAGHPVYLGAGAGGWVTAGRGRAALVLGPPRSGKTACIVIPAVLAARGPVVSTSTKPDVMEATAGRRAELGRCWLFDPSATVAPPAGVTRMRWSPVEASATWPGALVTARAMIGAGQPAGSARPGLDHWLERAEALLAPLLHAGALGGWAMADVARWVNRRQAGDAERALNGAPGAPGAGLAADLLAGVTASEDRELSGIWSTAAGALASYRSEAALEAAAATDIDPSALVASSDTVYVCAPAHLQQLVAAQVVGMVAQLRAAAYQRSATGPVAAPPLLLALDEVANIAPLPDLPATVAEGGGQGVLTLACLQDLSQGRARWGAAADGFLSLFGATVVLPGIGDVRTLQALSALAGDAEVTVRSSTRAGRGRRSTTRSSRRQPRLAPDQVARGRAGQAILFRGGAAPAWLRLTPWYATPPFNDPGPLNDPGPSGRPA